MKKLTSSAAVLAATATLTLLSSPANAAAPTPAKAAAMEASYAVFDRQAGTFVAEKGSTTQYRSASIVKLLIAMDLLWDKGTDPQVPAADKAAFDAMLTTSDDGAATAFWNRGGQSAIVTRMMSRLQLEQTSPPSNSGIWGYTAISPQDTVKVYRYLLDTAPAGMRTAIMDDLRKPQRCASDGFEQTFGIPSSFKKPWAVKQGWSGFGASANCPTSALAADPGLGEVDLTRRALHSTGVIGKDDRSIVAIFTLHPTDTKFAAAYNDITNLTRTLKIPGAELAPLVGPRFSTWSTGVKVRSDASSKAKQVGTLPESSDVTVKCQKKGEKLTVEGTTNEWWAYLPAYKGYITNIYVQTPGNKLAGVPDC